MKASSLKNLLSVNEFHNGDFEIYVEKDGEIFEIESFKLIPQDPLRLETRLSQGRAFTMETDSKAYILQVKTRRNDESQS